MSHQNVISQCHIKMSYQNVTSKCHIILSHHIWMSQVTYEWVMSHMNESCHIWMHRRKAMSHDSYQNVISKCHISFELVTSHIKESCHICMSHVTYRRPMSHMNESHRVWIFFCSCQKIPAVVVHRVANDRVRQSRCWCVGFVFWKGIYTQGVFSRHAYQGVF